MIMKKTFHALVTRIAGLTLIEIMVALGVLSIVVAIAVPSMTGLLEKRRVIAAADEILGVLTYAKAETNATNSLLIVRFDQDPSTDSDPSKRLSCAAVTLGLGTSNCECYKPVETICRPGGDRALRLFQLPQSYVKFDAFGKWPGEEYQLRFTRDKMSVDTDLDFHVDIEGKKVGYKLSVELNAAGHARICMPKDGKMSGYAECIERSPGK